MKSYIVGITLIIIGISCAKQKVDVNVKGKIDPIEVDHQIKLDDLTRYFAAKCEEDLITSGIANPTQDEIDTCVATDMAGFLDFMNGNVKPSPTPTPTPTTT